MTEALGRLLLICGVLHSSLFVDAAEPLRSVQLLFSDDFTRLVSDRYKIEGPPEGLMIGNDAIPFGNKGLLTGEDLCDLDLCGVGLVVLSACEPLRKVNDRSSRVLMSDFNTNVWDAFRAAQLTMLREGVTRGLGPSLPAAEPADE